MVGDVPAAQEGNELTLSRSASASRNTATR
jgi:hypothetical protein